METSSNTEHRETDALAGALAKADLSQPSDTLGAHPPLNPQVLRGQKCSLFLYIVHLFVTATLACEFLIG